MLIAHVSDFHLRPRGVPAYRVSETNMFAERAIDALKALDPAPDAVIVTGDIVDGWLEEEYRLAATLLKRLPMPVYLLAGNHDDSRLMKSVLGDFPGLAGGDPERVFYAADIGAIRLVVLDSTVPGAGHGALSEPQLAFLEAELCAAAGRPVLVAVHHPPIVTGIEAMDRYRLMQPEGFAAVLARHGNVLAILSGHLHRAISGRFAGVPVIVVPGTGHQVALALGPEPRFGFTFEPPAFYLHRWTEADGLASHLAYVERFPGPYPFYPAEGFGWAHPI